jgi:hypothetical protein
MSLPFTDNVNLLNATTVSVTNTAAIKFDCSKRQLKSIQFTASGITSGNGVFGVEVSNDGVNWVVYNRLTSNVANTNVQTDTRVAAPTLSSSTSQIFFFPTSDLFRMIRIFVAVTTDGAYTATLQMGG